MAQGYMLQICNATGWDIVAAPGLNSAFSAQMTTPWAAMSGGSPLQYFEASGANTFTLYLYSSYDNGFSQGSVDIVFDSKATSTYPNGQIYVAGFTPPQATSNLWVYPIIQMSNYQDPNSSIVWTCAQLVLLPTLDPVETSQTSARQEELAQ